MSCSCTTTPLRLFIRSLAQVDLQNVVPTLYRQTLRAPVRRYTTDGQHDGVQNAMMYGREGQSSFQASPNSASSRRTYARKVGPEDSYVEFSPESIDALALEVKTPRHDNDVADVQSRTPRAVKQPFRKTGTNSRSRPNSSTKPVYGAKDGSAPVFRKTRTESTGFKLHYSAPPSFSVKKTSPLITHTPPAPTNPYDSNGRLREGQSHGDVWALPATLKPARRAEAKRGFLTEEWGPPKRENWQIHKEIMKEKFPDGWNPKKKLSPDALAGIRALHAQMPEVYSTAALADSFEVSPEAIRRILKSKWAPSAEEESDRAERWFERGKKIYTEKAAAGEKPPKKWRELGIGNGRPDWLVEKRERNRILRENGGVFPPRPPLAALLTTTSPKKRKELSQPLDLAETLF
ncbi:required for respiratory growth protein 9, mitochondrial [Calycina marina]|uniref:Required for respiratory growth protein 9, mitochondrial n=1 Tax=Calycina marina TaxID=1763456 RepID=A0A9P7ZCP8_9HELO|nr:required for respiratory growth protein 9, mitochondrial [Calycina marina]